LHGIAAVRDLCLAASPAPERQDGERPDREAVAKALCEAAAKVGYEGATWNLLDGRARNAYLAEADAAIALLSPPLPARSSDAVSVDRHELAWQMVIAAYSAQRRNTPESWASVVGSTRDAYLACADTALSLLPARSSEDAERDAKALDELATWIGGYVKAGNPHTALYFQVIAALRSTGRLAAKEQA
jgi:hypothetical protein